MDTYWLKTRITIVPYSQMGILEMVQLADQWPARTAKQECALSVRSEAGSDFGRYPQFFSFGPNNSHVSGLDLDR
jgi:hypothetical protein